MNIAKSSAQELREALHGRGTDHHRFLLHLHLQHIEFADAAIQDIDRNVTALITRMDQEVEAGQTRAFLHELISAVADMPQQKLDNALKQLVHAELMFRRGTPPDAEYTFKHVLVHDAAYSTLLRSRRQQLHARIAAALEDLFPEIVLAQPTVLAQHCAEAGLVEGVVAYWLKAGQQAIARSAMTEAVGRALEAVTLLAQGLAATRATGAVLIRPMLLIWLAETHAILGQRDDGLNCLAEASNVIETAEERIDEAELHRLRGDLLNTTGDQAAAEQSYHRALAVAQRQRGKMFELRAATSLARFWRDQGERAEARNLLAPVYGLFTEGFDTPDLKEAKTLLDELT
jgi:predicted ATPase